MLSKANLHQRSNEIEFPPMSPHQPTLRAPLSRPHPEEQAPQPGSPVPPDSLIRMTDGQNSGSTKAPAASWVLEIAVL
ncbi:hypothetical protein AAFF_G00189580 [Aldrovandia affinis]|uniref:Uncharacterized protein n=1 Tax=Aldrovandia affinis TaxID=143900 RepID=A0AAD7RK93_9TELE|nr:hypothetical protein AAFF_G00189580 [Aldrovandia affinis]